MSLYFRHAVLEDAAACAETVSYTHLSGKKVSGQAF